MLGINFCRIVNASFFGLIVSDKRKISIRGTKKLFLPNQNGGHLCIEKRIEFLFKKKNNSDIIVSYTENKPTLIIKVRGFYFQIKIISIENKFKSTVFEIFKNFYFNV